MRFIVFTLMGIAASTANAELVSDRASPGDATTSTSGMLLSRLGGVRPFTTGSASPMQRDLVNESQVAQSDSNTIYYASLTLRNPVFPDAGTGELGEFTNAGDNGVVTGGGGEGSANGGDVGLPTAVPAPDAASLAFLGMALLTQIRRRSIPHLTTIDPQV